MLKEIILLSHRRLGQLNAQSSPLEVIEGGKMGKSYEAAFWNTVAPQDNHTSFADFFQISPIHLLF